MHASPQRSRSRRTRGRRIPLAATPNHHKPCPLCDKLVDGLQVAFVLGVAEEHHLLPFDLPQRVVLDHDDLDIQAIAHDGRQLAHQHAEPAVTREGDDLSMWKRKCSRNGVWDTAAHRGQQSRTGERVTLARVEISRHHAGVCPKSAWRERCPDPIEATALVLTAGRVGLSVPPCADLSSACGRVRNAAKAKQTLLELWRAGFFVPRLPTHRSALSRSAALTASSVQSSRGESRAPLDRSSQIRQFGVADGGGAAVGHRGDLS